MADKFLDSSNVLASIQHICHNRMPQIMEAHAF